MTSSHLRRIDPINRWIKDCGMLFTGAQVRHAATVVFPMDFDGGEHVYRVHPINVQLVTDPVIMPAKEEHDVVLVQKVLTITSHVISCVVMLKDVIKVSR